MLSKFCEIRPPVVVGKGLCRRAKPFDWGSEDILKTECAASSAAEVAAGVAAGVATWRQQEWVVSRQ